MATIMAPTSPTLKRPRDGEDIPSPSSSVMPSPSYEFSKGRSLDSITPAATSPIDDDSTTKDAAANTEDEPLAKKPKLSPSPEKAPLKTAAQREKEEKRLAKEAEKRRKEEEKVEKKRQQEADKQAKLAEKEAEKQAKLAEKEAEKQAKLAEKEAEKKAREDEKRKKEEEKAAERHAKEEEKRLKEEQKKKKENSQMRLNMFFKTPSTPKQRDGSPVASTVVEDSSRSSPSPSKAPVSEYHKIFLPFCPGTNVTVAPFNRFEKDTTARQVAIDHIDKNMSSGAATSPPSFKPAELFQLRPEASRRGKKCISVQAIMEGVIRGSELEQQRDRTAQLEKVQYKFLGFYEDVRPPYMGSYTKEPVSGTLKMRRNPFIRDLPDKNYDYDSEPEWQEPEEGEDIASDGEDDEEGMSEGGDMDGFLDDADDQLANMKRIVMQGGDLQPESTGLCWEDPRRHNSHINMNSYRMEILHEKIAPSEPINPFATHYWGSPQPQPTMEPPRLPLQTTKITSYTINGGQLTLPGASAKPSSAGKKLIPAEEMAEFKQAINGSDLSKAGLIEVLYKKFNKHGKAAVKDTLEIVAKRVGSSRSEKRWVLNE